MKASAIEFRFRMVIQVVIVSIAMWAPWVRPWDIVRRRSTLEWMAIEISRLGVAGFNVSTPAVSLLLTPSGALLMDVLVGIFYLRLVLGEEAFLTEKLGEPYRAYLRAVPRIVPGFRSALPRAAAHPQWLIAILAETTAIGTFLTMAFIAWTYDNTAMLWGILISFVFSMVVRGLMKDPIPTAVFLVVAPVAWGFFHLSIVRAGLIAFGALLVTRALVPKKGEKATTA
jgi:hypothetical protein